ncbi:RNA-directed DNA polymerase, eukaryota, partial [Tanacetum coccineum]
SFRPDFAMIKEGFCVSYFAVVNGLFDKRVFPNFYILGWYSTGADAEESDMQIHKALMDINESPVYLLLNPLINHAQKDLPVTIYESGSYTILTSQLRVVETKSRNMCNWCNVAMDLKEKFLSFEICSLLKRYKFPKAITCDHVYDEADNQANMAVDLDCKNESKPLIFFMDLPYVLSNDLVRSSLADRGCGNCKHTVATVEQEVAATVESMEKAARYTSNKYVEAALNSATVVLPYLVPVSCFSSLYLHGDVNGSPTKEFQFRRGLRQGDPLSPFLFLLVMENLHIAFMNVMEKGLFSSLTIGAIPTYYMSMYKASKGVVNQLESIRNKFFIGADMEEHKITWISWKKVLAAHRDRDLGVSSIVALNHALLF